MLALAGRFEPAVFVVLFGSPWIVAIIYLWSRRPRDGTIPPSFGEQLRKLLGIE
jgi:hypothetical protein